MKKVTKNKKGFTLIELVIVIAILGILAAIGITLVPKLSSTSRETADKTVADQVRTAAELYIAESGDIDPATTLTTVPATLIGKLQGTLTYNGKSYGPYLDGNESYTLQQNGKVLVITYDNSVIKVGIN